MELGGLAADPEQQKELRRTWKALMAIGIVAIVIGCVAIIIPAAFSVGTAIFIGWILIFVGGFMIAAAFNAPTVGTVLLPLLWAALTILVGVCPVIEPRH